MSMLDRLRDWHPIAVGEPAPALSLTADEGTWVRMPDFKDHINVILVFFRTLNSDNIDNWLKGFQVLREKFEEMETALFGVTTYRTDKLREYRTSLGLDFYLLYDPLALDSRKFRCSGRVRPYCKNSVVVVGKDGKIAYASRGIIEPDDILRVIAELEGVDLDISVEEKHAFSTVRNPGQRPDEAKIISPDKTQELLRSKDGFKLIDVRTKSEYDASHVPGSTHIPVDEVPHRYQELGQMTNLIFICEAGGRAAAAAEFITSIGGSQIYIAEGGIIGWSGPRTSASSAT
jgi:rhodanese-related sulfurtransferase/peroxiredoxin